MNSEDFNRLEQLFFKFSCEIKDDSQKFKDVIRQDFLALKNEIKDDSRKFKDDIKEEFQHQLTVQREGFQKQLAFVGEGFQMLSEKIDRVETRLDKRMDCLEHKLVVVAAETNGNTIAIRDLAADLAAHRRDTEAHPPVYRVKE